MSGLRRTRTARPQQGVATLTIVAILFFIVALVAAYTNRNLIFEQRTASNQWRSTLALEAADGGVEWVLAQINAGRLDASCIPSTDVGEPGFRQRYLRIAADGRITPVPDRSFGCVSNGAGGWTCSCPVAADPALAMPTGGGVYPAFRGRFVPVEAAPPGVIGLEVNGCTRLDDRCLAFPAEAVGHEGRATVLVTLALRNALATTPVAAITVRGGIEVGGGLGAFNPDGGDGGHAVFAGGVVSDSSSLLRVGGAVGSPGDRARLVLDDDALLRSLYGPPARLQSDRLFAATFMVWPQAYEEQPAALVLECDPACDGDEVRDALALNPGRVLWIKGDVDLDGAIGSASEPAMLVVQGEPRIDGDVFGVVYVRQTAASDAPQAWAAEGSGTLTGALFVEGAMDGSASFTVLRERTVIETLQHHNGSFVRVPGSWRDY